MKDKKVIFMGTPDFSVPVLEMLIRKTNVVLVVTQPDSYIGRKKVLTPSPVKEVALKNNISVFQPEKLNKDYELLSEINPDLIVTCAYGQIVSEDILNIPKYGCINVHASLLPKYRGASPIQYALLNGDKQTGVTIMYMDKGMDTGDMISKIIVDINDDDNFNSLHDKLSIAGCNLLENTLESIFNGTNKREKQNNDDATYTKMIKREDELIDLNDDIRTIYNKIRAFSPMPLAYLNIFNQELKIVSAKVEEASNTKVGRINMFKNGFSIECKNGIIYPLIVKGEGKKAMDVKSFINGINNK